MLENQLEELFAQRPQRARADEVGGGVSAAVAGCGPGCVVRFTGSPAKSGRCGLEHLRLAKRLLGSSPGGNFEVEGGTCPDPCPDSALLTRTSLRKDLPHLKRTEIEVYDERGFSVLVFSRKRTSSVP